MIFFTVKQFFNAEFCKIINSNINVSEPEKAMPRNCNSLFRLCNYGVRKCIAWLEKIGTTRSNHNPCRVTLLIIVTFVYLAGQSMAEEKEQEWLFEAEKGDVNVGLNGVVEIDADASGGKAVVAKTGRNFPELFHRPLYNGPCSMELPWGEYEATFRMKVANIKGHKPVVRIDLRQEQSKFVDKPLQRWEFTPDNFKVANQYQDFKVTFKHNPYQWMQMHVIWLGKADFAFDCYRLKLIRAFSTSEIATHFPWTPLDQVKKTDGILDVLFLKGPAYQFQKIDEGISNIRGKKVYDTFMKESYVFKDYGLDGYFPDLNENFSALDVIIMGGIDAESIGSKRMKRIAEFSCLCGGGVLMLPGPYSFGKGRFKGSPIEAILPVEITGAWDWCKFQKPQGISITGELPELTRDISFSRPPHVLWYTKVGLPKDAKVILKAGDIPILVVKECGKGRTAAILALPCGEWDNADTPFWEHEEWSKLMKNLIIWLSSEGDIK